MKPAEHFHGRVNPMDAGRFPHRNRALGREDTAEEAAFLADGGFAG